MLPKAVYYVETSLAEGETRPYYGLKMNRMFTNMGHVMQFLNAHKKRPHKIWVVKNPVWEQVRDD